MRGIKSRAWIHEDSNFECENKPCMVTDFAFEDYMPINDALYKMQADRHVLMQYTGLKDKNGVEIFEGDIYHQGDPNITYTVVWHDSGLIGKQNGSSSYAGLSYWRDRIEVIGNIYENPELLEVQA